MVDFNDPVSILTVFVPIIVGAIAGTYYITKIRYERSDRQTQVYVEKVKESDYRIRKIRVRYVNKPIERCNVSFNGTKLVWDSTDGNTNFTIVAGSQRNATIPDSIFTEDAEVIVRSDKKVLKRINFKDIDLVQ